MSEKLTPKQLHFARCVASGMSQSDAYKEAFDVSKNTKSETVWVEASKLANSKKVARRIEYLVAMKEKAIAQNAVSLRGKVLEKLEHFMENAQPNDNMKIRSAELLGKSVGLFKEVIQDERNAELNSDELIEQLESKLAEILEPSETKH
jgi:hypothetical protein